MKCEQCVSEGKTSRVYEEGGGLTTLLGWSPYYDEDGKKHEHDPNGTVYSYRCSNGHKWSKVYRRKCPSCGRFRGASV